MDNDWSGCKKILCIRADNMGDLLMSSPAIRALKETFGAIITVLTSSMATGIAKSIPEIDTVITYDLPWVKTSDSILSEKFFDVVNHIKEQNFDAAVIFSVYSQNPLPAAMLAFLAGIPLRLSYCRENPYELLTDWIPDKEPLSIIKHQVQRDYNLVEAIGAKIRNDKLQLSYSEKKWISAAEKLGNKGININEPWLILHAGVSEQKRQYPANLWIETAKNIRKKTGYQVLLTGGSSEKSLTDYLQQNIGAQSFSVAGEFDLEEFIALIKKAPLIVSVNTGTIHIAAAVNTPVIVLYALSNPQHFPWKAAGKVLPFDVPHELESKNEIIRYVNQKYFKEPVGMVHPDKVTDAIGEILNGNIETIPALPDILHARQKEPLNN